MICQKSSLLYIRDVHITALVSHVRDVELGSSEVERSPAKGVVGGSIPGPGKKYLGHLSSIHTHPCSPSSINWYL